MIALRGHKANLQLSSGLFPRTAEGMRLQVARISLEEKIYGVTLELNCTSQNHIHCGVGHCTCTITHCLLIFYFVFFFL